MTVYVLATIALPALTALLRELILSRRQHRRHRHVEATLIRMTPGTRLLSHDHDGSFLLITQDRPEIGSPSRGDALTRVDWQGDCRG
jgi:hypothetical protein